MEVKRIWKIYFSATRKTKKICETLTEVLEKEFNLASLEYDFTLPKMREAFPELKEGDLVVFGMPTYAGRLPNLMLPYLDTISGNGAMAIPFVTFGNRNFDNSLIELRNILESKGFKTVSGAAFSCEHSFSYELAKNRPDDQDLAEASGFAKKVADKIKALDKIIESAKVAGDPNAGYYQPRDRNENPINILKVKPKTNDKCINCMACVRNCPMGAINPNDPRDIVGKCVKCNRCVKFCTMQAKYFDDPGYLYHKSELEFMYGERRAENSFFI